MVDAEVTEMTKQTMPPEIDAIVRGFMESRALLTAIELDAFGAIADGATAGKAAARMGTDTRATEALLNVMVAMGLATKRYDVFHATPETARFLASQSPESLRTAMMHAVNMWNRWHTLTDAMRAGRSVWDGKRTPEQTEAFIAAMDRGGDERAQGVAAALDLAHRTRVLDVGGGSGAYSIAFARANPKLRCVVFDLEPVTKIAQRHIATARLGDRVTTQVGDFHTDAFESEAFDVVLISQILHMLSPDDCVDLLKKCHDALMPGGEVVIQDFILSDDKTAPRRGALFALNMLVATRGGNAYSGAEYRDWLARAGFGESRVIELPDLPTGLVTGVKR